LGAVLPYLPLILSARGASPQEMAAVMLLNPISGLLVPPLWGVVADALEARAWLLRATGFGCAVGVVALIFAQGAWTLLAMGLFCFFRTPAVPLVDSAVYAALPGQTQRYAVVRVWGSVGFAIFALLVGALGGGQRPALTLGIAATVYVASSVVAWRLPTAAPIRRYGVFKDASFLVARSRLALLFLGNVFYYTALGAYDIFYGLELKAQGHGDAFIGLAWGVAVASEIVLMFTAPRWTGRFSAGALILVASLTAIVRWWWMAHNTWIPGIFLGQLLHAFTFGLWYLSVVRLVQERAPETLRTTVQAFSAASMSLGTIVGYAGGSELFAQARGAGVFQAAAVLASFALLAYAALAFAERSAPHKLQPAK